MALFNLHQNGGFCVVLCRLYGLTGGTLSAYIVGLWCGVGCIGLGVWGYVSEVLFYTCLGLALVPFGVVLCCFGGVLC
jgi:hypothetical protein